MMFTTGQGLAAEQNDSQDSVNQETAAESMLSPTSAQAGTGLDSSVTAPSTLLTAGSNVKKESKKKDKADENRKAGTESIDTLVQKNREETTAVAKKEKAEEAIEESTVKPYTYYNYRKDNDVTFGQTAWDEKVSKDQEEHISAVKDACEKKQKKLEKKIALQEAAQKKADAKRKKELAEQEQMMENALAGNSEIDDYQRAYTKRQYERVLKNAATGKWKKLGKRRWTSYCPGCNTPANSYASSSGIRLFEGCVADASLPLGTIIKMKGKIYIVTDRCGTDAVDIFHDTPNGCRCNSIGSGHADVYVLLQAGQKLPHEKGISDKAKKNKKHHKKHKKHSSTNKKRDRSQQTDKKKPDHSKDSNSGKDKNKDKDKDKNKDQNTDDSSGGKTEDPSQSAEQKDGTVQQEDQNSTTPTTKKLAPDQGGSSQSAGN